MPECECLGDLHVQSRRGIGGPGVLMLHNVRILQVIWYPVRVDIGIRLCVFGVHMVCMGIRAARAWMRMVIADMLHVT